MDDGGERRMMVSGEQGRGRRRGELHVSWGASLTYLYGEVYREHNLPLIPFIVSGGERPNGGLGA